MQQVPTLDFVVSTVLAAKLLDVTDQHLRSERTKGKGPSYIKDGGNVLYRVSVLGKHAEETFTPAEVMAVASEVT